MRTLKVKQCKRIQALSFTPDGRQLLVVGGYEANGAEHAVWLDLDTGRPARALEFLAERTAVTSDHGRFVVAQSSYDEDDGTELIRWADPDGEWHEVPFRPEGPGEVHVFGLGVSPDGGRLVIGYGRQVRVAGEYDWTHHLAVWQADPPAALAEWADDDLTGVVTFRPDGRRFAVTGGPDAMPPVSLFDIDAGQLPPRFTPPGTRTRALAFSPDGTRLAAANARAVYVLSADDLRPVYEVTGHKGQVNAIAFSPDGRRLLTASHDGAIRAWDAATGAADRAFDWGIGAVTAVAFAPDGLTCAVGGAKGQVIVWDVD